MKERKGKKNAETETAQREKRGMRNYVRENGLLGFASLTRRPREIRFCLQQRCHRNYLTHPLSPHRKKIYIVYHHTSSEKNKKPTYSSVPSNIFVGASLSLLLICSNTNLLALSKCYSFPRPNANFVFT